MNPKTAARKELNGVLAMLSLMKGLLILISIFLRPLLVGAFSIAYDNKDRQTALENITGTAHPSGLLLEAAISLVAVLLPIWLYLFLSKKNLRDVMETARPSALQIATGVGMTLVGGYSVLLASQYVFSVLFTLFGRPDIWEKMISEGSEYPSRLLPMLLIVIVVAVFPAFMEETALRGIALSATKKFGICFSLLFSGLFFGFLHNTLIQIPFACTIGVLFAYFTLRYRTIWVAVISHFIFNLNSTFLGLIEQNCGDAAPLLVGLWMMAFGSAALALCIVGIVKFRFRRPDVPRSVFTAGEKWGILLRCPFLYVFVGLVVGQIVLMLFAYSI